MNRAIRHINYFARSVYTDKMLMAMIVLIVIAIIAIIVLSAMGKIPSGNQDTLPWFTSFPRKKILIRCSCFCRTFLRWTFQFCFSWMFLASCPQCSWSSCTDRSLTSRTLSSLLVRSHSSRDSRSFFLPWLRLACRVSRSKSPVSCFWRCFGNVGSLSWTWSRNDFTVCTLQIVFSATWWLLLLAPLMILGWTSGGWPCESSRFPCDLASPAAW